MFRAVLLFCAVGTLNARSDAQCMNHKQDSKDLAFVGSRTWLPNFRESRLAFTTTYFRLARNRQRSSACYAGMMLSGNLNIRKLNGVLVSKKLLELFSQQSFGSCLARNLGAKMSKDGYISDSDDVTSASREGESTVDNSQIKFDERAGGRSGWARYPSLTASSFSADTSPGAGTKKSGREAAKGGGRTDSGRRDDEDDDNEEPVVLGERGWAAGPASAEGYEFGDDRLGDEDEACSPLRTLAPARTSDWGPHAAARAAAGVAGYAADCSPGCWR